MLAGLSCCCLVACFHIIGREGPRLSTPGLSSLVKEVVKMKSCRCLEENAYPVALQCPECVRRVAWVQNRDKWHALHMELVKAGRLSLTEAVESYRYVPVWAFRNGEVVLESRLRTPGMPADGVPVILDESFVEAVDAVLESRRARGLSKRGEFSKRRRYEGLRYQGAGSSHRRRDNRAGVVKRSSGQLTFL